MRRLCAVCLLIGAACAPGAGSSAVVAPNATAKASGSISPGARAAVGKSAGKAARCVYRVTVVSSSPLALNVSARCEGTATAGFAPADAELVPFVSTVAGPVVAPGQALVASHPAPGVAELAYSVDLEGLARVADDSDTARRFGASLLAPASSFLLVPDPPEDGIPTRVFFDSPGVETGLRASADGEGYAIESHELRVATYTAFGARAARDLHIGDATVRLALLDGALDLGMDELSRWVAEAAGGVGAFFHRPPEAHTLVVLAPLPDRHGIAFGKLLPESGPGLIVLVGEHTRPDELPADWVLVHELFHVGTPSYLGEGKWYDEGLATYFEPLIRVRLGWRSEADLWSEFVRDMPRGLEAMTRRGLDHPESYSDVYWGGGLFCLLADVEVRRQSAGTRGLEDGVRAVLEAGGLSSEVWTLAQATALTDRALGAPILAKLEAAHLAAGSPVDLPGLFRELGVKRGPNGTVSFDERAPLAGVRHAIAFGTPK